MLNTKTIIEAPLSLWSIFGFVFRFCKIKVDLHLFVDPAEPMCLHLHQFGRAMVMQGTLGHAFIMRSSSSGFGVISWVW